MVITTYTACPNCASQWEFDEIEEQYCGACGYPNHNDEENAFAYPDYDPSDDVERIDPGDILYH